jgi:hypothetical protein
MSNFSGGLGHLGVDSRFLQDNEGVVVLNCDVSRRIGELHAVKDNKLLDDSLSDTIHAIHQYKGSRLVHAGDSLHYPGVTSRTFSGTNPMVAFNQEGFAYLCNGVEYLRFDGSEYTSAFIDAPDSSGVTVTETTGGLLPQGTYHYLITSQDNSNTGMPGQNRGESPPDSLVGAASITITLTGDNKRVSFAGLPSADDTNIIIYRWELNQGFEFRQVTEITDKASTFIDNIPAGQLGPILKTQEYATPPIPKHITMFNSTAMLMGIRSWQGQPTTTLDNYLFWSDNRRVFGGYDPFFLAIIGVGGSDDRIMNGDSLGLNFYTYTQAGVFGLGGTQALQYLQFPTMATTGLAAEFALTNVITLGHLILGSDRRLHIFNGTIFNDPASLRKMDELFSEESSHIHRMNWSARDKCRMVFFDGIARLAYPSVDSTENDKVLNMDFRRFGENQNIIFTITDKPVTAFFADEVNNQLLMGNADGEIREVEKADTYLSPRWDSKDFDGGDINADKIYNKVRLDTNTQGKDVNLLLFIDDQGRGTPTVNKSSRRSKFSTFKSYQIPNKGTRSSFSLRWDHPKFDVTFFDYEVHMRLIPKS